MFRWAFDFLDDVAGFPISESLIPYTLQSSNFDALIVGILNTLLVAVDLYSAGDHRRLLHRHLPPVQQ